MSEKKKPAKKAPAKKQVQKKQPAKKAPAKKTAKKAAAPKATQAPRKKAQSASTIQTRSAKTSGASVDVKVTANVPSREETMELLAKVAERASSNMSATVVRANDVVNKTLRQRMLAWFKKDK